MTRKDTILIAVVINAGLLAILFATAIIYDTEKVLEQSEFNSSLAEAKEIPLTDPANHLVATGPVIVDEVDNVLKYYSQPSYSLKIDPSDSYNPESIVVQANSSEDDEPISESSPNFKGNFVEITVKKGDVLEKIARANGTTINAIKKANNLPNEKLSIGQVLKIPLNQVQGAITAKSEISKKDLEQIENNQNSSEAVYYIVKSGDNPWKIAKQFNVKYEDILRLNQLDEEKARNLKIGDRIRVK
ncbi:LysM peptidoglycan-binding domain-containing protein [Candidatus Protochlamydia amoebophila]|nr:LysM peptidoglycan-binding domain-containing protein [Candidatus Protochlamydia amoebophila]